MSEFLRAHDDRVANLFHFGIKLLAPVRTSDTKYTGNCCFAVSSLCLIFFSMTKAPLTVECVAETYKMRGYPYSRLDSVGKCSR
jgi:hypothetical protein